MKLKCVEGCKMYLTAGKEYEVEECHDRSFWLVMDNQGCKLPYKKSRFECVEENCDEVAMH